MLNGEDTGFSEVGLTDDDSVDIESMDAKTRVVEASGNDFVSNKGDVSSVENVVDATVNEEEEDKSLSDDVESGRSDDVKVCDALVCVGAVDGWMCA